MDALIIAWFCIIAFCVVMYVILDGFTLGTGILLPWIDNKHRDIAMSVLLPSWDGNQTWLVLGGASLYGAFPLAFSTLLPVLYLPLIFIVLALLFRGVVFEFRLKAKSGKANWDRLFSFASLVTAFIQGIVLGTFVQGFDLQQVDKAYHYLWLTPFTLTTGIAVVCGYALLGASRLMLKTEGPLRDQMRKASEVLVLLVAVFMLIVSLWTPELSPIVKARWFGQDAFALILVLPVFTAIAFIIFWLGIRAKSDVVPYWSTVVMFLCGYMGLGYSLWPYIVPHEITLWQAAAPPSTLRFIIVGAVIMIPVLLFYTGYSYYIFRGKVKDVIEY